MSSVRAEPRWKGAANDRHDHCLVRQQSDIDSFAHRGVAQSQRERDPARGQVMTPSQAAQLFVDGKREECWLWCLDRMNPDATPEECVERTAAVALELVYDKSTVRDFLRMMAEEDAPE